MSESLNSLNIFNNQQVPSLVQIEKKIKLSLKSVAELKQELPELADNLDRIFNLAIHRDNDFKSNTCKNVENHKETNLEEKDFLSNLTLLVGKLFYENRQVPFIDLISINPNNEIEHSVLIPGQGIQNFNLGDYFYDNQNDFVSYSQYMSDKSVPVNLCIEKSKHIQDSRITQHFNDGINSVNILIQPLQNYLWQSFAKNRNEEMPDLESPITMEVSIPNPKVSIFSLGYKELYEKNSIIPCRISISDKANGAAMTTLYELNPSTGKYKVVDFWNNGHKIPDETLEKSRRFNTEKTLDEVKATIINTELNTLVHSDLIKSIFNLPRKGFPIPTDIIKIVEDCNQYVGQQELLNMNSTMIEFFSQKGIVDYVQTLLTSGKLAMEDTIPSTSAIEEEKEV